MRIMQWLLSVEEGSPTETNLQKHDEAHISHLSTRRFLMPARAEIKAHNSRLHWWVG